MIFMTIIIFADTTYFSLSVCVHRNTNLLAEKRKRLTPIARKCTGSTLVNRINPTNKHYRVKSPFTSAPEKNDLRERE